MYIHVDFQPVSLRSVVRGSKTFYHINVLLLLSNGMLLDRRRVHSKERKKERKKESKKEGKKNDIILSFNH